MYFILISWQGGSLMMPDIDALVGLGAKDTALIAKGEYWRIITPVFMHIGILHFLFNNFGIYIIAPYIEMVFGRWFFLLIYLGSGILGNLFSSIFTLNVSAGASGSLFGLMGAGFCLEYLANRRFKAFAAGTRSRAFAFLLLINLTLGLFLPSIDIAAHLGGLLFGLLVSLAILYLRANNLLHYSRQRGGVLLALLLVALFVGTYLATSRGYVYQRLIHAADSYAADFDQPHYAYRYYSDALLLQPSALLYFKRGRLLVLAGQSPEALTDFRKAAADPDVRQQLRAFLRVYRSKGYEDEADFLEKNLYDTSI